MILNIKKLLGVSIGGAFLILSLYIAYLQNDPVILTMKMSIFSYSGAQSNTGYPGYKLQYIDTIPIVSLEGFGYYMGRRHGEVLAEQIQQMVYILKYDIIRKNTVGGFLIDTYLHEKAKKLDSYIPEIYREEMKGIADGANVSYNDILFINIFDDLLNLAGCSSLAMIKTEKNSLFFHARNLDYPVDILSDKNVIFYYKNSGFLSVGFPGYIGVLSATNSGGITLSSHTSYGTGNDIGVPSGIIYRQIMEDARNIHEVEDILKKSKRTIANNLLISSLSENKSVVFEITAHSLLRLTSPNYAIATNHFASNTRNGMTSEQSNSMKRYFYLQSFVEKSSKIDVPSILELFSFYDGNNTSWSSIANIGTVQSVIFFPEEQILYIAKGKKPPVTAGGYDRFEYKAYFKGDQ